MACYLYLDFKQQDALQNIHQPISLMTKCAYVCMCVCGFFFHHFDRLYLRHLKNIFLCREQLHITVYQFPASVVKHIACIYSFDHSSHAFQMKNNLGSVLFFLFGLNRLLFVSFCYSLPGDQYCARILPDNNYLTQKLRNSKIHNVLHNHVLRYLVL